VIISIISFLTLKNGSAATFRPRLPTACSWAPALLLKAIAETMPDAGTSELPQLRHHQQPHRCYELLDQRGSPGRCRHKEAPCAKPNISILDCLAKRRLTSLTQVVNIKETSVACCLQTCMQPPSGRCRKGCHECCAASCATESNDPTYPPQGR
jgi:hypothetical protein